MLTTLELQAEGAAIIEKSVSKTLEEEDKFNSGILRWKTIRNFPGPITLIYSFGKKFGLTTALAREIAAHCPSGNSGQCETPGRHWHLSADMEIITTPLGIRLRKSESKTYLTELPSETRIKMESLPLSENLMKKIKKASLQEIYLPAPPDNYEWRTVLPGDRIRLFPPNHSRTKLLSDVFREHNIILSDRSRVIVLFNRLTEDIVWIPGIRRGGSDLITSDCTNIWHWQVI